MNIRLDRGCCRGFIRYFRGDVVFFYCLQKTVCNNDYWCQYQPELCWVGLRQVKVDYGKYIVALQ